MKTLRNLVLMLLFAAGWICFIIFGLTELVDVGYGILFGADEVYIVTGNLTCVPFVLGMVVFGVLVWLFSPYGLFGRFEGDEEGIKAKYPMNKRLLIAGCSILLLFVGTIISMTCYEKFTLEGVERCRFGFVKEYTWEEAVSFTLKKDSHGVLKFQVRMKDGSKHYFNGGAFRAAEYYSDGFNEVFQEDCDQYMLWLARMFAESDVPLEVKNWDKMIDSLVYPYWKEVAEEIREEYETAK